MATVAAQSTDPFYQSKRRTWQGFKRIVLTSIALIVLVLALMAIFLL
jgi:hypothetical protein